MNYSYKLDNDVLVVSLEGRLDTEASAKFETAFAEISKESKTAGHIFRIIGS